jgi:hypothetical protein
MARQDYGDELTTPVQQPGGKLSNDGYGLLTATVVWKADKSNDLSVGNRHSTCPLNPALTAHKFGVTYDALGVATITVDYIGIDPTVNGGEYTNPQVSAANGLTSENITSHPNFFAQASGYGPIIAGSVYVQDPTGPLVEIKNPADFVSVVIGMNSDGTPITGLFNKKYSYVGFNGACFESIDGGRFIGFIKPTYKHFYGKTNYLANQTAFSGHFYTSDAAKVQKAISLLNVSSSTNNWNNNLPNIVPLYAGTEWNSPQPNPFSQLLLSQVNVEDFGSLYKVNYEVRYAAEGWHNSVYRNTASIPS